MNQSTERINPPPIEEVAAELQKRVPFDRMETDHVRWFVQRSQRRFFPQGTPVLEPGQEPDCLYYLWEGAVQMEAMAKVAQGSKILAEILQGECFPIEALQEKRPVFSTFRTKADTTCYEISRDDFLGLQERSPYFRDYCRCRAEDFLDSSRRLYHAHYSKKGADQFNLGSPLSLLLHTEPTVCSSQTALRDALALLDQRGQQIVVVVGPTQEPVGVFSIDDLLHRIASGSLDTAAPISAVMSRPPVALPLQSYGHEAAVQMAMHGYKHILVTDKERLVGVLSERDLFSLQRVGLSEISSVIHQARELDVLSQAGKDIHVLALNMLAQGVSPEQMTRIISTLNDQLTERIIGLELERSGVGGVDFCWLSLGSEGRYEQTLCTDQDNGIVFEPASGQGPEEVRAALVPVADRINQSLAACGFPLCKGKIMAGNPQWCLSTEEWKKKFSRWIQEPKPEALLHATIFFDLRGLHGDAGLAGELQGLLAKAAPKNQRFLVLMAENALQRAVPLGFFKNFIVDRAGDHPNTFDLKLSSTTLFVDAARVFSLAYGLSHTNTARRFGETAELGRIPQNDADAWIEAFYFVQMLRLRQQFEQSRAGQPMHNRVNPDELNDLDRRFLVESLRQAGKLQKRVSAFCAPR